MIIRGRVTPGLLAGVAVLLSLFYVQTYLRVYDPKTGWTSMIHFGSCFDGNALPRLRSKPHAISPPKGSTGADGQFYAQMALDPSLQDPAFDHALDTPTYRARRIGLPALAFVAGLGKPRYILQVYALANLFFWFVLMGALFRLLKPRTGRPLLCLGTALLSYGVIASMQFSMTDLPAGAMVFVGLLVGSWGGFAALAAATLTRETSVLAVLGCLDPRRPWRDGAWKRQVGLLALGTVPFALWIAYVLHRFGHARDTTGTGNFGLPLQAMGRWFAEDIRRCFLYGLSGPARDAGFCGWLYADDRVGSVLTIAAFFFQGLYIALRRDLSSAVWRTGILYTLLGAVLGGAVWEDTANAVRVLIPLTVCFYLLLARERGGWFWPFFILGSLSVPYGIHVFWTLT